MVNVYICSTAKDAQNIKENNEGALLYELKTHFEDRVEMIFPDSGPATENFKSQIKEADIILIYLTDNFCMKEEVTKLELIIRNEHLYKYAIFPVIINRLTSPTKSKIAPLLFMRHIFPNEQTALSDFSGKQLEKEIKNIIEEFGKLIEREEDENETYLQIKSSSSQSAKLILCEKYISQCLHGKFRKEVAAIYNTLKLESSLESQWKKLVESGTVEAVENFIATLSENDLQWRQKAMILKEKLQKERLKNIKDEQEKLNTPQSYYNFLEKYPRGKEHEEAKKKLLKLRDNAYTSIRKSTDIVILEKFLNDFPKYNPYADTVKGKIEKIRQEERKKENEAFLKASIQARKESSVLPIHKFLENFPVCSEENKQKANELINEISQYKPFYIKVGNYFKRRWKVLSIIIAFLIGSGYFMYRSFCYNYGWAGIPYIYAFESDYMDIAKMAQNTYRYLNISSDLLCPYTINLDSLNKEDENYSLLHKTISPYQGKSISDLSSPQVQAAIKVITQLADKQIPEAMYIAGNICFQQKDLASARNWYKRCLEKDYIEPLYNLSYTYRESHDTLNQVKVLKEIFDTPSLSKDGSSKWRDAIGDLIDIALCSEHYRDDTLAFNALKQYYANVKASGGGYDQVYKRCLALALMYMEGIGTKPDTLRTLQIASELTIPEAYFLCGYMHYKGYGTDSVNYEAAAKTYEKILTSVPQGKLRRKALYNTGYTYIQQWKQNIKTKNKEKNKEFDINKIVNFLEEAKRDSCKYSANFLGYIYVQSDFLNTKAAIENLEEAMQSDKTKAEAYFNLGVLYYYGKLTLKGVFPHDKEKGEEYLKKAAEMNIPMAEIVLKDKRWWNVKSGIIW